MTELLLVPPSFKGDWITPDHADYSRALARWAANAQRKAKVVAFVKDPADVVAVIEYARAHGLPLAIRGGGHNVAGSSSIEGGIVIDLSRHMGGARVDAEKRLAHVGGGAIWETVDKAGMEHGLATPGGTINDTGVGGLILGGGFGHLSGQYGMVVDNLQQVTLVTADGSVLTVNETENPDLFWAVRGGGSNFGVVTEFVLKMYPQRRTVFSGFAIYPQPKLAEVMVAVKAWWADGPAEKASMLELLTVGPDGKACAVLLLFWNGSEVEGREHFMSFFALNPAVDTCKEIPYEQLNGLQNSNVPPGMNYYMKSAFTSRIQPEAAVSILNHISERAPTLGMTPTFIFEYIPLKKILSAPRASTAWLRANLIGTLTLMSWKEDDPTKLDEARMAANELNAIILSAEDNVSAERNTGYGNYLSEEITKEEMADPQRVDRSAALFKEHYPRLQALKKQYDPDLVFNKWYVITPA